MIRKKNFIKMKISERIKSEINYLFFRRYRYRRVERRHLAGYYGPDKPAAINERRQGIFMADGPTVCAVYARSMKAPVTPAWTSGSFSGSHSGSRTI